MGGITSIYAKINSVRYLWFAFYQTWYGVQGNDISELLSSTDRVYITAISDLSVQNHLLTIDLAWIQ